MQFQDQVLQCAGTIYNKFSLEPQLRKTNFSYGRFTFIPIERVVGGNVCEKTDKVPYILIPLPTSAPHFQQIITQCTNCTSCKSGLKEVLNYLLNFAEHSKIWLIVMVRGTHEADMLPKMDFTSRLRVVFVSDEVQVAVTDCQVVDEADTDTFRSFSKTSVLFVSVSFIILMVVSLAWLIIYYVQRFRYANAKDRLQRRLFNAAKRALSKIPTRSVRVGDKELDADCPVCIDPYQTGDIIRSLPCKHVFHKTCVDLWLLEHRTCPMCKSDILKAMGYRVSRSRKKHSTSSGSSGRARPANVERLTVDVHVAPTEQTPQARSDNQEGFNYIPSASPPFLQFSLVYVEDDRQMQQIPSVNKRRSTDQLADLVSVTTKQSPASGQLIDIVHPRSRSLSHVLYFEKDARSVQLRSQTYTAGLNQQSGCIEPSVASSSIQQFSETSSSEDRSLKLEKQSKYSPDNITV
ncbi:unnamed protein product [Enterobius vermicularis]|uniref:RING-type domain-containing protein n=1 Tax=Enterobius vermicularis TaxID=51028 RepID=A0A0N4VIP8_ENTVE|nr:unnamed protein product [Enterobius vermicularis]